MGPIVTHPVQESFSYPAGEVCAFPSHADFPVQDLTLKTWTDAAGNAVFATESGPLYMRTTNLDTGKSVLSDISGSGVITYPDYPDESTYVLSGDDWSAGFHTTDSPVHNHWIVAQGYMSVKIAPSTASARAPFWPCKARTPTSARSSSPLRSRAPPRGARRSSQRP